MPNDQPNIQPNSNDTAGSHSQVPHGSAAVPESVARPVAVPLNTQRESSHALSNNQVNFIPNTNGTLGGTLVLPHGGPIFQGTVMNSVTTPLYHLRVTQPINERVFMTTEATNFTPTQTSQYSGAIGFRFG